MRTIMLQDEVELEAAGLMVKPANRNSSRHSLLRPRNLRLTNERSAHPWITDENWQVDPDEDNDDEAYFYWEALEEEEVDPGDTWQALWELLRLEEAAPREIEAFISRWGLPAGHWDFTGYGDRFGFDQNSISVDEWRELASYTARLVTLLAKTAQEELIDGDLLESIQSWDETEKLPDIGMPERPLSDEEDLALTERLKGTLWAEPYEKRQRILEERRWQKLLRERQSGEGLQQQRRILSLQLNSLLGMQYATFLWDERGRFMLINAYGIDEIVFSHVMTMFLAPDVDVLICSVCGIPYPFDDVAQRRPRYGVRRFCSDECRREGKRESNRLSWRRNSSRWRRSSARKLGQDEPEG